ATVAKVGSLSEKAGKVMGNIPVLGQKTVKVISEATGLTKEVPVRPITLGALVDNPAKAIQDAAQYSHVNSVNLLNKLPKVNIDPFSAGGIAAGAATQTGIKVATKEGAEYGMDKLTSN
ncbi:MAG: hypothetical protein ACRDQ5_20070, partial [Sciscionella sp.]